MIYIRCKYTYFLENGKYGITFLIDVTNESCRLFVFQQTAFFVR